MRVAVIIAFTRFYVERRKAESIGGGQRYVVVKREKRARRHERVEDRMVGREGIRGGSREGRASTLDFLCCHLTFQACLTRLTWPDLALLWKNRDWRGGPGAQGGPTAQWRPCLGLGLGLQPGLAWTNSHRQPKIEYSGEMETSSGKWNQGKEELECILTPTVDKCCQGRAAHASHQFSASYQDSAHRKSTPPSTTAARWFRENPKTQDIENLPVPVPQSRS
jgi:hypothetical protein